MNKTISICHTGADLVLKLRNEFSAFGSTAHGKDIGALDAPEFIAAGSTRQMPVVGYIYPAATNTWRP